MNDKNNTVPLGKQICFTIVWGCAKILHSIIPAIVFCPVFIFKVLFRRMQGSQVYRLAESESFNHIVVN